MSSENMGEEGGGDVAVAEGGGGGGAGAGVSRWSPTKEQISLLEGFYREGVRTPSAEQIQEITARLRAYGQIEGKNVFYWFQNHKARQRQKQKQESLLAYNNFVQYRYLHPPSFLPPPAPNVDCGPYYPVPKSELVFPSPSPTDKVLIPAGIARRKRKPGNVRLEDSGSRHDNATALPRRPENNVDYGGAIETLPLFPLHPTGVLRGTNEAASGEYSTLSEEASEDQATFDFFSSN